MNVLKALNVGWKGTRLGVARVFLFWKGGLYTYIGISLIPIGANWPAISQLLRDPSWAALGTLFGSVGTNVALALGEAADAAQQLPGAGGWTSVDVFGVRVPAPEVAVLLWIMMAAVITVGWYFRTTHLGVKLFGGENVPPVLSFLIGLVIFALLIWGATGSFPVEEVRSALDAVQTWLDGVHGGVPPGNESVPLNGTGNAPVK